MDPDRDDTARLRRGDTSGLAGLMGRHQDRLLRYLLRLLGDEAVAEDTFQQTWVQVAERISRYDPARPFGPWLFSGGPQPGARPPPAAPAREPRGGGRAGRARRRRTATRSPTPSRARGAPAWPTAVAALAPLDREVLSLRFEEELALPELARDAGRPGPDGQGAALPRARPPARGAAGAGAGGGLAMSGHVRELLALAAAGALDPEDERRVEAHLARVRGLRGRGRGVAPPRRRSWGGCPRRRPSRALVARTVEAVEERLAERAERAWNRAALGFLVAFAWTLAVVSWLVIDLVAGGLAVRLGGPVGSDGRVVRGLPGGGMVVGGRGRGAPRPAHAGGREDRMSRFDQEWALVPDGARWTAALVCLAVTALMGRHLPAARAPGEGRQGGAHPLAVLPCSRSIGVAFLGAYVLLVGYVYGDARRRGMNHVLWTLLAIFIPNAIGIILYFILRDPVPVPCPTCGDAGEEGTRLLRGLRGGGARGLPAVPSAGGGGLEELRALRRGARPAGRGAARRRAVSVARSRPDRPASREDPLEDRERPAHAAGADEEVPDRLALLPADRVRGVAQPPGEVGLGPRPRAGSSPSGRSRDRRASSPPRARRPSCARAGRRRGGCRRGPSRGGGAAPRPPSRRKSAVPGYGVRTWKVAVSMPCAIAHSTVRSKTERVVLVHAEDEAGVDHHAEVVEAADGGVVVAAEVLALALRAQACRAERLEADEEAAQAARRGLLEQPRPQHRVDRAGGLPQPPHPAHARRRAPRRSGGRRRGGRRGSRGAGRAGARSRRAPRRPPACRRSARPRRTPSL